MLAHCAPYMGASHQLLGKSHRLASPRAVEASKVTSVSPESVWNAWNSQSTVVSQEASETWMILSNPLQAPNH